MLTPSPNALVETTTDRSPERAAARRAAQDPPTTRRPAEGDARRKEDPEARRAKAIELAVETLEALGLERGDGGKIRTSVLKDAIKRRKPDFNETYFGFRSFGALPVADYPIEFARFGPTHEGIAKQRRHVVGDGAVYCILKIQHAGVGCGQHQVARHVVTMHIHFGLRQRGVD